ncbi:MAG: phosphonate ABC transporter substrate-binding protein [Armatimonadetes bacterium]|nr:phosphonate ABC transporter substrate-binding protein [Armatimonadota bacterium]
MRRLSIFLAALGLAFLFGCSAPSGSASNGTSAKNGGSPGVLHIALSPSEDSEKMAVGFEPIRAQLAKDLEMDVKVDRVTDYSSVIEAQRAGKVDVAWYGPLSMILANQEAGAEPILIGQEEGKSTTYFSMIIVPANSPAKELKDLKGKKIALVDPGSTSGNLVPRMAVLKATNATAEEFFGNVAYAGSHDAALLSLVNGNVDACAIQDITFNAKCASKEIDESKFRVLWKSDPIPQSPIAVRKDLDPQLKEKIVQSFLAMDSKGVKMDVPGVGDFQKFHRVTMDDYQVIAEMASALGLSKNDMGK